MRFYGLEMNQGPWGPWNKDGNKGKNSGDKPQEKPAQKKEKNDFLKNILGGADDSQENNGGGGNNNDSNKPEDNSFFDQFSDSPKKTAGLAILGVITLWLLSGFYKIDSDENGVVLYFGKFYQIVTPGLNYRMPYPFSKVIKQSVTRVNTEEFGYNTGFKNRNPRNLEAESLMLTGDENIVDIEFQVQWQISDVQDFTFNVVAPSTTIHKAAESAMREIIARTPISEALSDGKSRIEQATRELLQQTLDSYKAGVRIVLVQLRRVDPPSQVIDAFRDVQTAKADKEKEINQAQAYANDIIPRARGSAAQMYEQAEAFKQQVVADAQGEASRFLAVYGQYANAKAVTKRRIYLETMEEIYGDMDKVMIDKNASSGGITPYFPLNDLSNNSKAIIKQ